MHLTRKAVAFPILLTNDDGIHSPGLHDLASALNSKGHPLVILAPLTEQSAVGMKLTLRDDMKFQEHPEIADRKCPIKFFEFNNFFSKND